MATTAWTESVLDATSVKAIYGSRTPTLDGIVLHEIVLHRDGPKVQLRFDLKEFPEHPPEKWLSGRFNRVQLRLMAMGVKASRIDGLCASMTLDLHFEKKGESLRLHADNGRVRFELTADVVIVNEISAYREEQAN